MCGRVRQRAESAGKCPERLTEQNSCGGRESLVGKNPAHLEGGYVQSENMKNETGRISKTVAVHNLATFSCAEAARTISVWVLPLRGV